MLSVLGYEQSVTVRELLAVLASERRVIQSLEQRIDETVADVVTVLKNCKGHIVVCGLGKSGLIGRKIAASLASTGSPSFFMHATEACHGDLGCVRDDDLLLALSASGETEELIQVATSVKNAGSLVVSFTSNRDSTLARLSDFVLDVSVDARIGALDYLPTLNSLAMLAMGDAITVALLKARNFTREDFAACHPGGALGRRLNWQVSDVMKTGDSTPITQLSDTIGAAVIEMTRKRLGATFVMNEGKLVGIFTDGDLRRVIQAIPNALGAQISCGMTPNPKSVLANMRISQALDFFEEQAVLVLAVLDCSGELVGAVHLHDVVKAGLL